MKEFIRILGNNCESKLNPCQDEVAADIKHGLRVIFIDYQKIYIFERNLQSKMKRVKQKTDQIYEIYGQSKTLFGHFYNFII